MKLPWWGVYALSVQLILMFFAPAITLGTRNVFLTDLWGFCWLVLGLWHSRTDFKRSARFYLISFGLCSLIYLHGYFRDSIEPILRATSYFFLAESDLFSPAREAVVAFRFLSWLWAGRLVWHWFEGTAPEYGQQVFVRLCRVLSGCLIASFIIMMAAKILPPLDWHLADVYGYTTDLFQWKGRIYGTFRSPLEASTAMAIGGLLLVSRAPVYSSFFAVGVVCSLGAIVLTHGGTAAFGLILAGCFVALRQLSGPKKFVIPGLVILVSLVSFTLLCFTVPAVKLKWMNLAFRFHPWKMYLDLSVARWDYVLLGYGFAPYHVDNNYLFVLNRGGIVGFVALLGYFFRKLMHYWQRWSWREQVLPVYLMLMCLTLDVLIYRSTVVLLLAVGLPALAGRYKLS